MEKTWQHQQEEKKVEEVERGREIQHEQRTQPNQDEKTPSSVVNGFDTKSDENLVKLGNAFEKLVNKKKELENGDHKRDDILNVEVREDKSEMNVYYDKEEGIWKCRSCHWTYESGSPRTEHIEHPKWYLHMLINPKAVNRHEPCFYCEIEGLKSICGFSETENNGVWSSVSPKRRRDDGLVATIKNFHDENININGRPMKENAGNKYFDEITVACDDIESIENNDAKSIKLDIEKVLEKQDTHDLYCPNCNSCITKKVVLRKRKRKTSISIEDAKRNKFEAVEISLNRKLPLLADDNTLGSEAEVFRCLSCFSFLIPSGNGFRLFKIFEDKRDEQTCRPVPATKKSWFSSISASHVEEEDDIHEIHQDGLRSQGRLSKESLALENSHFGENLNGITPIETEGELYEVTEESKQTTAKSSGGADTIITVEESSEPRANQELQGLNSVETRPLAHTKRVEYERFQGIDIVKSIVYGGLAEFIASLGIVSSAVGADTVTLKILALGLANLIGGLFIISQKLWDLKSEQPFNPTDHLTENDSIQLTIQHDKYQHLLGRRENFLAHATIALLSYLVFGMLPPITYALSFRESDNNDHKLIAVAGVSLICILILSTGKAYIGRPPKAYSNTVCFYVIMVFMTSGVSYAFGHLFKNLLENLRWLSSDPDFNLHVPDKSIS